MADESSLFHYSVLHGYVVPDSEDGFDDLDIVDSTGLVTCPFVKIPYDKELDESHCKEYAEKIAKEKKRRMEVDLKAGNGVLQEEDGRVLKKLKGKEEAGPVEKDKGKMVEDIEEEEIDLPNLILGMYCPLYKTMPQYRETKLNEPLLEFPPLKIKDLPAETLHHTLSVMLNETRTSKGMICNTFQELEDHSIARVQQMLPFPIFPVGPIHKYLPVSQVSMWTEDKTSIAWLSTKAPKSVLYVSFGSVAAISKAEFLEVAWGLADSEQPFLWVVRTGLIQGSDNSYTFPEGYEEIVNKRGHIVRWAPQTEVLSHPAVGGFWTHSGWNSTMESISEGVPMLCLPLFGDQSMNARYVSEEWKIGLQLEKGFKREDITKAIRKLMVEEEGKEMRNRITSLKQKADLCLTEGRSSYKYLDRLISYLSAM